MTVLGETHSKSLNIFNAPADVSGRADNVKEGSLSTFTSAFAGLGIKGLLLQSDLISQIGRAFLEHLIEAGEADKQKAILVKNNRTYLDGMELAKRILSQGMLDQMGVSLQAMSGFIPRASSEALVGARLA